jgi:hypothetical protein
MQTSRRPEQHTSPNGARPELLSVRLVAHLTEASLSAALRPVSRSIDASTVKAGLVVDCLEMTGYDAAARSHFVDWNKAYRDRLFAIGIVTRNIMWHVVISSMALASGQKMKAFNSVREAEVWLGREASHPSRSSSDAPEATRARRTSSP